jgi:hypothetical protein
VGGFKVITIQELTEDSNWESAFGYADGFTISDIAKVHGASEGENDGDDWIIWGQLVNGVWFYLKAGCDNTGWDCQASGTSHTAPDKETLIRMGMDAGSRKRFGLMLPGEL